MQFGKLSFTLVLISFCLASFSFAQNWSGILDPTRAIEWSQAGIPGGIPTNRTQCGATVQASTYGNGSSDASANIQSALNACAANTFLLLGPGKFLMNSGLNVPSNVTLRGSGAQQTILDMHNTGGFIGGGTWQGYPNTATVAITGGAARSSASMTLASASGITVGMYLLITETNDPTFVSITSSQGGSCTWCGGLWGSDRVRGQIVEVTSVNGSVVGISPALYSDFTHTPWAQPFSMARKWVGIEDLQVYDNNTLSGYSGDNFGFFMCAYCWLKGVEGNGTTSNDDHVDIYYGYRDEVRDSYFVGCTTHGPGSADCDVFLGQKTSATLIENNIVERTHGAIEIDWGAAGNVIGYNYTTGQFDASDTTFTVMDQAMHGAHPQFNLLEGNNSAVIFPDSIWGTSSHTTLFRNWARGTNYACPPLTNGRNNFSCASGTWTVSANRAVQMAGIKDSGTNTLTGSMYGNIVGNVAGSANAAGDTYKSGGDNCAACLVSPTSRGYSNVTYDFVFGYGSTGDGSGYCASRAACPPYTTAFLHGNYSNAAGGIQGWASGVTQTLPASFYRSSKPAWWSNPTYTIPWPAIGPDVTGGSGPGGHASLTASNPAQACYNSTAKASDGSLAFDASVCYGGATSVTGPAKTTINNCSVCTGSNCTTAGCTIQ
jgi:hypothetical protein